MKFRSLPFLATLLLFLYGQDASAQIESALQALLPSFIHLSDSAQPAPLSNAYRLQFAIPDAPAFALLDDNPGDILRPSTVREFAIALSSFVDTATGGFDIPQALAVEFSPGLLIGGNDLTLKEYQDAPFLYRLRISAGTRRLSGQFAPSQIAFGLRTSFIDGSDLRTDRALLRNIVGITDQIAKVMADSVAPPPIDGGSGAEVVENSSPVVDSLNAVLQEMIANAEADQRWNADALDLAAAILLSSPDSTGKGLQSTEIAGWLTYAHGFGNWGQLLLGVKAGSLRGPSVDTIVETKMKFAGNLSGRMYMGTNNYKIFTEIQYASQDSSNTLLLNGGGEVLLSDGIWAELGGGVQRDLDAGVWSVVSKLSLKLGLPFLK